MMTTHIVDFKGNSLLFYIYSSLLNHFSLDMDVLPKHNSGRDNYYQGYGIFF